MSVLIILFFFSSIDDHTVINMNAVRHGRLLTVRILTDSEGESHDSTPVDLEEILKKVRHSLFFDDFSNSLISSSWIWIIQQQQFL